MRFTKEKGITLIALVITIIVLIILAGVSINLTLGENGLFQKAKQAAEDMGIASVKEQIQIDIFDSQMENNGKLLDSNLKLILQKYGTINYDTDGTTIIGITTKEGYDILLSDIWTSTFTNVANEPDISGFNKNSTYYVTWNLTNSPYVINEETNLNGIAPSDWYDYTAGVNHWANVKTTGGGNNCYWVWIPRYAYQVPNRLSNGETINIKFLKGTSNIPIGGTEEDEITNKTPNEGEWVVHPAFWWDKNNDGIEDEGEQLTGIWVAKFEASSSVAIDLTNLTAEQIATSIANDGGSDTDTELQVRVVPNVTSWRGITVNNIFTVCRNLTKIGSSLENTSNLDSHMMKNTEWGAVAYLSRSVYGKNGEVWNNPYYNNATNYSPITGLCGDESNGKDNKTTDITKTCKYNELGSGNASTTGNVYGIYDMVGGAWEYVAGILNDYKSNDSHYDFSNSTTYPNKYFDWYAGNSSDSNTNYNANTNKYGDAVYETSSSGVSDTGSWDSSISSFPNFSYPVFLRGGHANNGSNASVFAFSNVAGGAITSYSFRPVVLSAQP